MSAPADPTCWSDAAVKLGNELYHATLSGP
jgi:hypothetical protein